MQIKTKIEKACKFCDYIAYTGIFITVVITVTEFIFRSFGRPIQGVYDIVGLIQVILVCFAMPYCTLQKGHIRVDMFMDRLPKRMQVVIDGVISLLSMGFFLLVAWQLAVLGNSFQKTGDVSMTVYIPFYPFVYIIALTCFFMALLIVSDIVESIAGEVKR
ncbi:MAG TPA: TRAP transporter small permease [Syntrophorhabdaceae bacterium]|nr:TRAP transporter small permease [Syntrophorhabdaceae bacterium]HQM81245.1 TRAP transporter small permease [Syntrophorhabdaceae bacterium]